MSTLRTRVAGHLIELRNVKFKPLNIEIWDDYDKFISSYGGVAKTALDAARLLSYEMCDTVARELHVNPDNFFEELVSDVPLEGIKLRDLELFMEASNADA